MLGVRKREKINEKRDKFKEVKFLNKVVEMNDSTIECV